METEATDEIVEFLQKVTGAMGLSLTAQVEQTETGPEINLQGDGADVLLWHRGEPLKALQHVVDMAFGRRLGEEERIYVDCLGYRRGKEVELRQMARFLAERARQTGVEQEIGPLNPYERRIVHMAVAEQPGVSTESVGDAHLKTVIISATKRPS
ncbi:MAG TPA: R3H domain-containing nucleic acid-binding protein [Vicinamibacterales bacterium]|nr:R3H domain-containing nucleic acid-binding protein [Vicinamibacterales bacterium]